MKCSSYREKILINLKTNKYRWSAGDNIVE